MSAPTTLQRLANDPACSEIVADTGASERLRQYIAWAWIVVIIAYALKLSAAAAAAAADAAALRCEGEELDTALAALGKRLDRALARWGAFRERLDNTLSRADARHAALVARLEGADETVERAVADWHGHLEEAEARVDARGAALQEEWRQSLDRRTKATIGKWTSDAAERRGDLYWLGLKTEIFVTHAGGFERQNADTRILFKRAGLYKIEARAEPNPTVHGSYLCLNLDGTEVARILQEGIDAVQKVGAGFDMLTDFVNVDEEQYIELTMTRGTCRAFRPDYDVPESFMCPRGGRLTITRVGDKYG